VVGATKKTIISRAVYPNNYGAKIYGGKRHALSDKDMIGKQRRQGEGGWQQQCLSSSNQGIRKKHKNTTVSHQNAGGGHDCSFVSMLTDVGSARNKVTRVEQ
jgi:hypothetical protein